MKEGFVVPLGIVSVIEKICKRTKNLAKEKIDKASNFLLKLFYSFFRGREFLACYREALGNFF